MFIMGKMGTLHDETIHIVPKCAMHLHGHQNKVVPLMEPFIFVDFNNGTEFYNCTYKSINDIRSHYFPHWVSNHHIGKKDLVLSGHVEAGLY
jgi:5-methylcytosine-specific restriction endonuclease McrA